MSNIDIRKAKNGRTISAKIDFSQFTLDLVRHTLHPSTQLFFYYLRTIFHIFYHYDPALLALDT